MIVSSLVFLILSFKAQAGTEQLFLPFFSSLPSEAENSSLDMNCKGRKPFNVITCDFQQILISKKSTADHEVEIKANDKMFDKMNDIEFTNEFQGTCSKAIPDAKTKTVAYLNDANNSTEKKLFLTNRIKAMEGICDCMNKINIPFLKSKRNCVRNVLNAITESEKNSCNIRSNVFTLEFKRTASNKWISNPGPTGICDRVKVVTIEHEPDNTTLWRYSQTIAASKSNDPICKHFTAGFTTIFSWQAVRESQIDCKVVKF